MSVKNFYPEKPIVNFFTTKIEMGVIIANIRSLDYPIEIKRSAYIIIRNETGNGKSVINGTNVCGAQSDSGRWPAEWNGKISGVCVKNENMTGKERGFLVFNSIADGIAFTCERATAKGIYIGEKVDGKYYKNDVTDVPSLAQAYWDEWVTGTSTTPSNQFISYFRSMYIQSSQLFV